MCASIPTRTFTLARGDWGRYTEASSNNLPLHSTSTRVMCGRHVLTFLWTKCAFDVRVRVPPQFVPSAAAGANATVSVMCFWAHMRFKSASRAGSRLCSCAVKACTLSLATNLHASNRKRAKTPGDCSPRTFMSIRTALTIWPVGASGSICPPCVWCAVLGQFFFYHAWYMHWENVVHGVL